MQPAPFEVTSTTSKRLFTLWRARASAAPPTAGAKRRLALVTWASSPRPRSNGQQCTCLLARRQQLGSVRRSKRLLLAPDDLGGMDRAGMGGSLR